MEKEILIMDEKDNVAIAVSELAPGRRVKLPDGQEILVLETIPSSHKLCIKGIIKDESVVRYGDPIGYATCDIQVGQWVHIHNLDAYDTMAAEEGLS